MLKLLLFVVPLRLDTFAVSAALGLRGLPKRDRLKAAVLMSSFEMAMRKVRYFFVGGDELERLICDLATAEQGCCLFLEFSFSRADERIEMNVTTLSRGRTHFA